MYTPNLVPRDVHHLWLNTESMDSKQHPSKTDPMRQSFAPTLSSYLAAYPGAQVFNNADQSIPPDIQAKLTYLNSFCTLGYNYLKPLGLNKTMQNLLDDEELAGQLDEDDNLSYHTAENLNSFPQIHNQINNNIGSNSNANSNVNSNANNVDNANTSASRVNSGLGGNSVHNSSSINNPIEGDINLQAAHEVDLDAGVQDEDEDDNDNDEYSVDNAFYHLSDLDDNDAIDEDEGFMAADEEYQDDHSISVESNSINNFSGSAPITSTTIPTTTTGNTVTNIQNHSINSIHSNSSLINNYRSFSSPNGTSNLRREYNIGEVTVNGSDLDMMIDDE